MNTKQSSLAEAAQPLIYFALRQNTSPYPSISFATRSVKAAVLEADPRF